MGSDRRKERGHSIRHSALTFFRTFVPTSSRYHLLQFYADSFATLHVFWSWSCGLDI